MQKSAFVEIVRLLAVLSFTALGLTLGGARGAALYGTVVGAGIGYVAGGMLGRFLRRALGEVEAHSDHLSAGEFLTGTVGALVIGLLSALVGAPAVGLLQAPWGWVGFALIVWIGVNAGFQLARRRSSDLLALAGLTDISPFEGRGARRDAIVVDSSVLIDGRLLPLARTGFLHRTLVIPAFVLGELQHMADSTDLDLQRKGVLGLQALEAIRQDGLVQIEVVQDDFPEIETVDAKLVALALQRSASLLTRDEALARVAELRDVHCLNLQRLVKSLAAVRHPGDVLRLAIEKEGQRDGEGIGYLDEGSMVVVAGGADWIGRETEVCITTSTATPRGRIFFAHLTEA